MFVLIKKLIEANPLLRDKLQFPRFDSARLRKLINQRYFEFDNLLLKIGNIYAKDFSTFCSLNWEHLFCKNPNGHPDMKTLYVDHTCGEASSSQASYQVTD